MGCSSSSPAEPPPLSRARTSWFSGKNAAKPGQVERETSQPAGRDARPPEEILRSLDKYVLNELRAGSIRLVDADALRKWDPATPLPRRQQLKPRVLLEPAAACALLERGDRSVGVLTYCWKTVPAPDPDNETLRAVQGFLRDDPRGRRLRAVFWDWCSLFQKGADGDRTADETALFGDALARMGDL